MPTLSVPVALQNRTNGHPRTVDRQTPLRLPVRLWGGMMRWGVISQHEDLGRLAGQPTNLATLRINSLLEF